MPDDEGRAVCPYCESLVDTYAPEGALLLRPHPDPRDPEPYYKSESASQWCEGGNRSPS